MSKKIELGQTGTDIITGFTGVVTGYVSYLNGYNQVLLAPKVAKDMSARDAHWFDEQRVKIDPKVKRVVLDESDARGFGEPAPIR